jgi:hypothetical protein
MFMEDPGASCVQLFTGSEVASGHQASAIPIEMTAAAV